MTRTLYSRRARWDTVAVVRGGARQPWTRHIQQTDPHALAIDSVASRVCVLSSGNSLTSISNGQVSFLDAQTGKVLHTTAVGQNSQALFQAVAVDATTHPNSDSNTVSLLDSRTGAVLHTIHAGVAPSFVAIDAHIGHAFVLSGDAQDVRIHSP